MSLFEEVNREDAISESSWRPRELPSLRGIQHVEADTESTGLQWYGKDEMIGYSFRAAVEPWRGLEDDRSFYVPYAHRGPHNYGKEQALQWAKDELRGKDLYFLNAKHDVQFFRKAGVDLEAQGNRVHDVGFMAALLDEERKRYNLADLSSERLGVGKERLHEGAIAGGKHLMALKAAAEVGPYAERDAGLLRGLRDSYKADMDEEGLWEVLRLEDSLIWCVCEMERNATIIDEDLLDRYIREATLAYEEEMHGLRKAAGAAINPDSAKDMLKLFVLLGVPVVETPMLDKWGNQREDEGHEPMTSPSFADDILAKIQDATSSNRVREALGHARCARQIASLLSKYLLKYKKAIGPDGKLRYSLNQLGQDDYGTVTGRFSASGPSKALGYNPQQVFKPSRQARVKAISKWIIRRLFKPASPWQWLSADAMQIEIRLAAHYAAELGMPRLADMYAKDPVGFDAHNFVMGITKLDRDTTKGYNFMKLYGGGIGRAMEMTGYSEAVCRRQIAQYDAAFPEFKTMMEEVSKHAKRRGYVKTVKGRRRHCRDGKRLHAMLNAVIQGTAGDVMKVKMVEAYDNRKELGLTAMRLTVHDSVESDCEPDAAPKVQALLNEQSIKFRVPILWDVKVGATWDVDHKEAA